MSDGTKVMEPQKPEPRPTVVANAATMIGKGIGLDERMSPVRVVQVIVQTFFGVAIGLVGLGILFVWGRGFLEGKAPSIWFLVAGIGVGAVGAFLAVGEVVGKAIKSVLLEPFKAYRRAMGKSDRGES